MRSKYMNKEAILKSDIDFLWQFSFLQKFFVLQNAKHLGNFANFDTKFGKFFNSQNSETIMRSNKMEKNSFLKRFRVFMAV